jgi:hypothetical protein
MTDPYHSKPGPRPGSGGPAKPTAAPTPAAPSASKDEAAPEASRGRVVHDSRGNAVWQWVKDTGRHAIESTSALLKKLELPELKVQDPKDDNELRLEDDVDAGGGYDPYGTRIGSKKPPPPKTPFKKP